MDASRCKDIATITTSLAEKLLTDSAEDDMRYIIAWFLGVPLGVIILWYAAAHAGC